MASVTPSARGRVANGSLRVGGAEMYRDCKLSATVAGYAKKPVERTIYGEDPEVGRRRARLRDAYVGGRRRLHVDGVNDRLVHGSRTIPRDIEEFWTFTRAAGLNFWMLCAIQSS